MSTVNIFDKPPKAVKNLGWLLHNWKIVTHIVIKPKSKLNNLYCCDLIAVIPNGTYETEFMSYLNCLDWINRPVFKNLSVFISDESGQREFKIGTKHYIEFVNSL
jgi:hypothetical protein